MNISIGKLIMLSMIMYILNLAPTQAQQKSIVIDTVQAPTNALIIGLDDLNAQHIWASGTNATILKSGDGGISWESFQYQLADSLQFRAIKALSTNKALVMSAGEGISSQIFIFDRKKGWKQVYQMEEPNGFLDAIELLADGSAIAYGDAIDGEYFILKSNKDYTKWTRVDSKLKASESEGGFASSGSNIAVGKAGKIWIGTGAGGAANVLFTNTIDGSWEKISTPMIKGEAAGITSIRHLKNKLLIVGGDLAVSDSYTENIFLSEDNGKSWKALAQPLTKGAFYGADISMLNNKLAIVVCGPNGADLWLEEEGKWQNISNNNLWTAEFISPYQFILAGRGGSILRITLPNQP